MSRLWIRLHKFWCRWSFFPHVVAAKHAINLVFLYMIFCTICFNGESIYGTNIKEEIRVMVSKLHVLYYVQSFKCVLNMMIIESSDEDSNMPHLRCDPVCKHFSKLDIWFWLCWWMNCCILDKIKSKGSLECGIFLFWSV